MRLKTISVEQLALETGKVVKEAGKQPVLVRGAKGQTLVLRSLADDDLADEIITAHPEFRASVRQARRNHAAGRGVSLQQARRRLKS